MYLDGETISTDLAMTSGTVVTYGDRGWLLMTTVMESYQDLNTEIRDGSKEQEEGTGGGCGGIAEEGGRPERDKRCGGECEGSDGREKTWTRAWPLCHNIESEPARSISADASVT